MMLNNLSKDVSLFCLSAFPNHITPNRDDFPSLHFKSLKSTSHLQNFSNKMKSAPTSKHPFDKVEL